MTNIKQLHSIKILPRGNYLPQLVTSSEGVLGNLKGFVFAPSCVAFDDLLGSEDYFLLKCIFQDEMDNNTKILHIELLYKGFSLWLEWYSG